MSVFNRHDVADILHHTNGSMIALCIGTDVANFVIGNVVTDFTITNVASHGAHSIDKLKDIVLIFA